MTPTQTETLKLMQSWYSADAPVHDAIAAALALTRADQIEEDTAKVVDLVASLQAEAKAYATSTDTIYRCKELARAAVRLSEFMRAIRGRKAVDE